MVDPEAALASETLLFPEAGSNLALKLPDDVVAFGMIPAEAAVQPASSG